MRQKKGTYKAVRAAAILIAAMAVAGNAQGQATPATAITQLKADGGASRDHFLMQFQADVIGRAVYRPAIRETTALGAAYLAGLAVGLWANRSEIKALWKCDNTYQPAMSTERRDRLLADWHKAVGRCKDWTK